MALDKTRLKNNLKAAYQEVNWNQLEAVGALDLFCEKMANVLVEEIKQLQINYTNGLAAGSTAVTGNINHSVS